MQLQLQLLQQTKSNLIKSFFFANYEKISFKIDALGVSADAF